MRLAVVYNSKEKGLTGRHWTNNAKRFFIDGLQQSERLEQVSFVIQHEPLDAKELNSFDAVIFYSLENVDVFNLHKLKAVKVVRAPDPHSITQEFCEQILEGEVDFVINHHTPKWACKFLHPGIKYEQIIFGITRELHKSPPYDERYPGVLLTGALHRSEFYYLRQVCKNYDGVTYIGKEAGYVGDRYPELLGRHRAAIAACTVSSVYKYFEIPACGCVSFMEVNRENGCERLGFVDGESAIYINHDNAAKRIDRFVKNQSDPRYKVVAQNGREFVLRHYENRVQVDRLLDLIERRR